MTTKLRAERAGVWLSILLMMICGEMPGLAQTKEADRVPALLRQLQMDANEARRAQAATELAAMHDIRAIEPLIRVLQSDTSQWVQRTAVSALTNFDTPRVTEALLSVARKADHPARETAIRVLGERRDPQVVPTLLELLPHMPQFATEALVAQRDPRAVVPLLARLDDTRLRHRLIQHLADFRDARIVDALLPLLEKPESRQYLLRALACTRDPRIPPLLIDELRGPITPDRVSTVEMALSMLQVCYNLDAPPEIVQPLLDTPDFSIRSKALQMLARTHPQGALDTIGPLLQSKDAEERRMALWAVTTSYHLPLLDQVVGIMQNEQNPDLFMRVDALNALIRLPDARAVQAAIAAFKEKDIASIAEGNDPSVYTKLARNPAISVDDLLVMLRQQPNTDMREAAVQELARRADPRNIREVVGWVVREGYQRRRNTGGEEMSLLLRSYGPAAVDELLTLLNDIRVERTVVISLLGHLGDQRAVAPLLARAQRGSDRSALAAMIALARLGSPEVAPLLRREASLARPASTRAQAIIGLGWLRDAESTGLFLQALRTPGQDATQALLRDQAAIALLRLRDPRGLDHALTRLAEAPQYMDFSIHFAILDALPALAEDSRVGPAVIHAWYRNTEYEMELPLMRTAVAVSAPGTARLLQRDILTGYGHLRFIAIEGVVTLRDTTAVPLLIWCVNDPEAPIRDAAARALAALTGEDFGEDHARWVAWYLSK